MLQLLDVELICLMKIKQKVIFQQLLIGFKELHLYMHPYKVLVELGKKAQEDVVIRGILLQQGESNTGDQSWPKNLKQFMII